MAGKGEGGLGTSSLSVRKDVLEREFYIARRYSRVTLQGQDFVSVDDLS